MTEWLKGFNVGLLESGLLEVCQQINWEKKEKILPASTALSGHPVIVCLSLVGFDLVTVSTCMNEDKVCVYHTAT